MALRERNNDVPQTVMERAVLAMEMHTQAVLKDLDMTLRTGCVMSSQIKILTIASSRAAAIDTSGDLCSGFKTVKKKNSKESRTIFVR